MKSEPDQEAGWMDCGACDGHGSIEDEDPDYEIVHVECPSCNGMGYLCNRCGAAPAYDGRGGCWCHY